MTDSDTLLDDTLVGVVPNRFQLGALSAGKQARPDGKPVRALERVSLYEALTRSWDSWAHLVCYRVERDGQDVAYPRLDQPILPDLHARGAAVLAHLLVVDVDNPGHAPWDSDDAVEAFSDRVVSAYAEGCEEAGSWSALYTTRHGARLVWTLDHPTPVHKVSGLWTALVDRLLAFGIEADRACCDWTRLFGLPRVLREGEREGDAWWFRLDLQPDALLDVYGLLSHAPATRKSWTSDDVPDPQPTLPGSREAEERPETEADVDGLLFEMGGKGRKRRTEFHRLARIELQGSEWWPPLFEGAPIAAPGERDSSLMRLAGTLASRLYSVPGATPGGAYALALEAVLRLEPDGQDPSKDWADVLWDKLLRCWEREDGKQLLARRQVERVEREAGTKAERMVEGVRRWWEGAEVPSDPYEQRLWLRERCIAAAHKQFHVMLANGTYDRVGVDGQRLVARVRELGQEDLIPLWVPNASGEGVKELTAQHLINRHSLTIHRIIAESAGDGCIVRNPGGSEPTLVLSMFKRREDLEPRFDPDVDEWLRAMCGDRFKAVCNWLGHAQAFEEGPICALSFSGPPGCGKKLLALGLEETIDTRTVADVTEIGEFQHSILRTPYLWVNEGFPRGKNGFDPADFFRRVVGGDPISVNQKFHAPVEVRCAMRVLLTANNTDVLSTLIGARDLTPDDRAALAQRIMHVDVPSDAGRWLRLRGGLRHTKGWVRGDAGGVVGRSTDRLAGHLRWLYEEREAALPGSRMLVEGDLSEDVVSVLSARGGSAPAVIETLVRMIEHQGPVDGLVVDSEAGQIYATSGGVVKYWRQYRIASPGERALTTHSVSRVLRGFRPRDAGQAPRRMKVGKTIQVARWNEIDPELLHREAIEQGWPSPRLAEIEERIALQFHLARSGGKFQ